MAQRRRLRPRGRRAKSRPAIPTAAPMPATISSQWGDAASSAAAGSGVRVGTGVSAGAGVAVGVEEGVAVGRGVGVAVEPPAEPEGRVPVGALVAVVAVGAAPCTVSTWGAGVAVAVGTGVACGCYVEMRAARLDMHCPLTRAVW